VPGGRVRAISLRIGPPNRVRTFRGNDRVDETPAGKDPALDVDMAIPRAGAQANGVSLAAVTAALALATVMVVPTGPETFSAQNGISALPEAMTRIQFVSR
jgi:hypothetical protein